VIEMTDYEINRRLAVIAGALDAEGRDQIRTRSKVRPEAVLLSRFMCGDIPGSYWWNPLNDWSQLGPLLCNTQGHQVVRLRDGSYSAMIAWGRDDPISHGAAKTMTKALAIAIVDAYPAEKDADNA